MSMWNRPSLSAEDEMMGRQVTWAATLPATAAFGIGALITVITVLMATNGRAPDLAVGFFLIAMPLLITACCKSGLGSIQFAPDDEDRMSTANEVEVIHR